MPERRELAIDRVLSPTTPNGLGKSVLVRRARVETIMRVGLAVATFWVTLATAAAQDAATPPRAVPPPISVPDPAPAPEVPVPDGSSPAVTPPQSAPAPAQGAYISADAIIAHRMQAWLEYSSRLSLTTRITSGVVNAVSVAFFGVIGVAALASDNDDSSSARISRNIAGATFLGISAGYVYGAITDFAWKTTAEARLDSWRQFGENIDAPTLARFEGELAAEAALARKAQLYSLGSSIGLAASGGLLLALVPASDLSGGDRTFSYVVGGGLFVIGAAGILVSLLTEPHQVRAYRLYREGKEPAPYDVVQLRVAPVLGARDAGLMLSGRF